MCKCPECGAPEIDALSPRTIYQCGSSDYDQRPGTFSQSSMCQFTVKVKLKNKNMKPETEELLKQVDIIAKSMRQRIIDNDHRDPNWTEVPMNTIEIHIINKVNHIRKSQVPGTKDNHEDEVDIMNLLLIHYLKRI